MSRRRAHDPEHEHHCDDCDAVYRWVAQRIAERETEMEAAA